MASPNPNQQYPSYPEVAGQAFQQPPPQYVDNRFSQNYPQNYQYPPQQRPSPTNYVQPHYGTPKTSQTEFVSELPAPGPPAPPTSTSEQQLTEDELLAHKLQQMEVKESRERSNTNLSHRQSQYSTISRLSPQITQEPFQPLPQSRPHSQTVSSVRSHAQSVSSLPPYAPASLGPLPNQPTPSELPEVVPPPAAPLPEVVAGPRPASINARSIAPSPPAAHPTAHLPPPPADSASLPAYLELHRQVPYPPQWILAPITKTLYGSFVYGPKTNWLDTPVAREWRTVRFTENAINPTPPSFSFTFKNKGGNFRHPRYTWTMTPAARKDKPGKKYGAWAYELKMDQNTGIRKSEMMYDGYGRSHITTYIHAQNYDSLRFVGPDGRLYLWVAHAPLSSVNGARYDTLRHALFVANHGKHDPLYGQIVADHAYWDGYIDYNEVHPGIKCEGCGASPINGLRWKCKSCIEHDICEPCRIAKKSFKPTCFFTLVNLPDEALHIRSSTVDPALVVATLQILKDWELRMIRDQKRVNMRGFQITENAARKSDLGRISHWRSEDFEGKGAPADGEVHGTSVKIMETLKTAADLTSALGEMATVNTNWGGDGGGSGGDGGGGGGDGGGASSGGGGGDGGGGGGGGGG